MTKEEIIKRIEENEKEQKRLFEILFKEYPPENGNIYGINADGKVREWTLEGLDKK